MKYLPYGIGWTIASGLLYLTGFYSGELMLTCTVQGWVLLGSIIVGEEIVKREQEK